MNGLSALAGSEGCGVCEDAVRTYALIDPCSPFYSNSAAMAVRITGQIPMLNQGKWKSKSICLLEEIILRNRASRPGEPGAWNHGIMHSFKASHTERKSRKVRPMDRTSHRQF